MKQSLKAGLLAFTLFSAPAFAKAEEKGPEQLALDALETLKQAMELWIGQIPQYEAPEILPNGDIIMRRIQPNTDGTTDEAGEEETETET